MILARVGGGRHQPAPLLLGIAYRSRQRLACLSRVDERNLDTEHSKRRYERYKGFVLTYTVLFMDSLQSAAKEFVSIVCIYSNFVELNPLMN